VQLAHDLPLVFGSGRGVHIRLGSKFVEGSHA